MKQNNFSNNRNYDNNSIVCLGMSGNISLKIIEPHNLGRIFMFNCVMCGQSFQGTSNDMISHSMLCTGF